MIKREKNIREINDYGRKEFEKGVCGIDHKDFSIFLYNYPMSFIIKVSIVMNKEVNNGTLKVDRNNYTINLVKSEGFKLSDAMVIYNEECEKIGKCLGLLEQE